jgi:hypothetical protein
VNVIVPSRTPTQTETPTATATFTPNATDTATPADNTVPVTETVKPSDILVPVKTVGPPATPPSLVCPTCAPWPWWLIFIGLLLIALVFWLLFRRPLSLGPAGGNPFPGSGENATVIPSDLASKQLPAIQRNAAGNFTQTLEEFPAEIGGAESATVTIHDIGGFNDGSGTLPAIQRGLNENFTITVHDVGASIDPGGVQRVPGPPNKPDGS